MKVVPCTMGARAPTNEALTSLTWRSPARPDACSAPSIWWVSRRFARSAIAARSVRTAVGSLRDDGPRLGSISR